MKKKYIFLQILFICFFSIFPLPVLANQTTDVSYEKTIYSEVEPQQPNEYAEKEINYPVGKYELGETSDFYPSTGEKSSTIISLAGYLILGGVFLLFCERRFENEKK